MSVMLPLYISIDFFLVYTPFGFLPARGDWRRDNLTGTGYQLTMQGRDRKPHAQANDQRERVRTGEDAGEANPCNGSAPAQGQSRGRTPCA
jgi:hypothetical protein